MLFSSHILSDAEMICDRVGILYKGKLINIGSMGELLSAKTLQYELVVSGVPDSAKESLKRGAVRFLDSGNQVLLAYEEEPLAQEAIRQTVGLGGRIDSMTPRKETLEEYFIRHVKGESQ